VITLAARNATRGLRSSPVGCLLILSIVAVWTPTFGAPAIGIAAACRSSGSATECGCYEQRVRAQLRPSELPYLQRYLSRLASRHAAIVATANEYKRQHPLDANGYLARLAKLGDLAVPANDPANEAIAREMGGAEPFYQMKSVSDRAAAECLVGSEATSAAIKTMEGPSEAEVSARIQEANRSSAETEERRLISGREQGTGVEGRDAVVSVSVIPFHKAPSIGARVESYLSRGFQLQVSTLRSDGFAEVSYLRNGQPIEGFVARGALRMDAQRR